MNILEIGSYFDTDNNGYLINPTDLSKIDQKWQAAVDELKSLYISFFGDELISIYLRGSVPRGSQIDFLSDIDSFCVIKDKSSSKYINNIQAFKDERNNLQKKYIFINGIETTFIEPKKINSIASIIMLNQSVCIFGMQYSYKKIKPGVDCLLSLPKIRTTYKELEIIQDNNTSPEEIKYYSQWYTKQLLRAGLEATMLQTGRYSRDLYICYTEIALAYPIYKKQAYSALKISINPTKSIVDLIKLNNSLCSFLVNEASKLSKIHNFKLY